MEHAKTYLLFLLTAVAELSGCYVFMLGLRQSHWLYLLISIGILVVFAYLLTLHPEASGRVYAAYGGVYIFSSLIWLRLIDGVRLSAWDIIGGFIALIGISFIIFQPKN